MPSDAGRRRAWPLRATLAVLLVCLAGLGYDLQVPPPSAQAVGPGATTTSTQVTPSSTSPPVQQHDGGATVPASPTTTSTGSTVPTTSTTSTGSTVPTTSTTLAVTDPATTTTTTSGGTPPPSSSSHTRCPLTLATPPPATTTTTAPPTTTTGGSTTAAPPVHSLAVRAPHCTVLEIGDSLGNDLGWGLQRQLAGVPWITWEQMDRPSTGLANSWFYNWPSHLTTLLAQYHPDIVLVCLGGNDEQSMSIKGRSVGFATSAWQSTYLGYVKEVLRLATAANAEVLWIGMPVMQPAYYNQGMVLLNSLYARSVRDTPGAAFLPTRALLANGQGAFEATGVVNGVATALRSPDGIHFSESGENVLATYVATQLGVLFHVHLTPEEPAYLAGA